MFLAYNKQLNIEAMYKSYISESFYAEDCVCIWFLLLSG